MEPTGSLRCGNPDTCVASPAPNHHPSGTPGSHWSELGWIPALPELADKPRKGLEETFADARAPGHMPQREAMAREANAQDR